MEVKPQFASIKNCIKPPSNKISSAGFRLNGPLVFYQNTNELIQFDLDNNTFRCDTFDEIPRRLFKTHDAIKMYDAALQIAENSSLSPLITRSFSKALLPAKKIPKTCQSLGLTTVFEIESEPDIIVFGCQVKETSRSAIMWKYHQRKSDAEIAYLSLYQPLVDAALEDSF